MIENSREFDVAMGATQRARSEGWSAAVKRARVLTVYTCVAVSGARCRAEKAKGSVKTMLVGASIAGTTGAVWGACLAALRNESIKFYSASMAANFFLLSSTYIALEEVIADKTGKKDLKTGAGAGALTGGFYAGIIAGRVRGVQGAAGGAIVGAASVFGREQFQRWRLSKALERYEEKHGAGTAPAMYYPNTDILVETKGPVRDLEFPSLLPKSLKTTEEEIERRIQARVEELRQQELDAKNAPSPDTTTTADAASQ